MVILVYLLFRTTGILQDEERAVQRLLPLADLWIYRFLAFVNWLPVFREHL